jgi:hypothetical protein
MDDKAAYAIVDITKLTSAQRAAVKEDAMMGGGQLGLTVVEEYHNGPAREYLYGYYYGTSAEAKYLASGLVDSADGAADAETLREQAQQQASTTAADISAKEEAEVAAIAGAPVNKARR